MSGWEHGTSWLGESGSDCDVVLSSRVRLARNLAGVPFVGKASDPDRNEVVGIVRRSHLFTEGNDGLTWLEMEGLSDRERMMLVERHLISHQFADATFPRGVALSPDERLSVMINEEDHLRMQSLAPGLALRDAFERVSDIRDEFESTIDFAFSARWGFLTACPTNVGCGIRFSVMLHLPGLKMTEELGRVRQAAKDLHLAVRGCHGEGSESSGDLFQISNQITLGNSEEELLDKFRDDVVPLLMKYERASRRLILDKRRTMLEDKVHRALATLGSARILGLNEGTRLLSMLRLGTCLELVEKPGLPTIHRLLLQLQPGHLSAAMGVGLEDSDEDARIVRAELVRRTIEQAG
ncbi:MAG: ATP--guanido phosphotransferase [Planctomycetota bacterium]|nr:ATP--guanido phosphotransferase [Planctomycetota bacterium]